MIYRCKNCFENNCDERYFLLLLIMIRLLYLITLTSNIYQCIFILYFKQNKDLMNREPIA